jgi:hypothetical protein
MIQLFMRSEKHVLDEKKNIGYNVSENIFSEI